MRRLRIARSVCLAASLVWLWACADGAGASGAGDGFVGDAPPNSADEVGQGVAMLSPTDHLVRVSMALRGVRPSVAELEQVRDDPEAISSLVDEYTRSPEFGETVRDLYDEALLLRPFFFLFPPRGAMGDMSMVAFNRSVQESPLRLIEHVVMNDRPFSEVVTADYTVADGVVAEVWGMDYEGDGAQWVETRYPEPDRVHAGILTDSYLWVRHYSTPINAQRSRANAFSRAMLCYDFLARDVDVAGNIDLTDPAVVRDAVKSEACATCHQSLDPLANHFWSHEYFVSPVNDVVAYPFSTWRPEYMRDHRPVYSDRGVGYFGLPAQTTGDLGLAVSADPRFGQCAARRFYAHFAQVPLEEVPFDTVLDFHEVYEASGESVREMVKAMVLSDAFKVSHTLGEQGADELIGYKKVRPRQLSRMMADLTGFVWETDFDFALFAESGVTAPYGRVDLLRDSLLGFEVLAGGRDDFVVNHNVHTINPTTSLVYQNLAREAAGFVVDRDLSAGPEANTLLDRVGAQTRDEATVREQLAALHARFYGELVAPDSETVGLTWTLFEGALALSDDPARAWKVTLTAMLQDSRLLYY